MRAKELKEFLASVPDDAEVTVSDVTDKCIAIQHIDRCGNIVYLDTQQEFPVEWYDENCEEIIWE